MGAHVGHVSKFDRPAMDSAGKHRIKLLNKIGKGAFGDVYRCTYDEEVCAVKTLPYGMEGDQAALIMFHREADILRGCNHRRIIRFKALCKLSPDEKKHGGKWALVLEFAKGGTLSDKVAQTMTSPGSKVYSTTQALSWALDVATALEYLHLRSPAVLHRDVKLGNIVICKEEGEWVAKLGDFGLHVVVDSMRDRLLRVSFARGASSQLSHFFTNPSSCLSAPATPVARQQTNGTTAAQPEAVHRFSEPGHAPLTACRTGGPELTQQHLQELQKQLMLDDPAAAIPTAVPATFDKDSARQQLDLCMKPPLYGGSAGTPKSTSNMPLQADPDCEELDRPCGAPMSTRSTPITVSDADELLLQHAQQSATSGPATSNSVPVRRGPSRSVSFRQAGQALADEGCGACTDTQAELTARRAAALYAKWHLDLCGDDEGSMCSLVTEGTWLSGDTCGTGGTADTAEGSNEEPVDGSTWTDVQTVFNMTGQTGSYLYMAPEVFMGQPYNEKADVFSFGVVLYELLARCLLLFTELPTNSTDPVITEQYASKVCGGYRPSRPKRTPDNVWALIEDCWHQEPARRPSMSKVVTTLQQLLREQQQQAAAASGVGRRMSLSLAGARHAAGVKAGQRTDAPTDAANPAKSCLSPNACPASTAVSQVEPTVAATVRHMDDSGPEHEPKQCGCVIC